MPSYILFLNTYVLCVCVCWRQLKIYSRNLLQSSSWWKKLKINKTLQKRGTHRGIKMTNICIQCTRELHLIFLSMENNAWPVDALEILAEWMNESSFHYSCTRVSSINCPFSVVNTYNIVGAYYKLHFLMNIHNWSLVPTVLLSLKSSFIVCILSSLVFAKSD
jgi:hypothetical protein